MNAWTIGFGRYLAIFACTLAIHTPATAQSPSRAITLVVPFPAGGTTDSIARLVAQKMSDLMQTIFVVENRGGASGTIGTTSVVRATPDGHTLLLGATSTLAVVPHMMKVAYVPTRDFAAIGGVASVPSVLISTHKNTYPDFASVLAESRQRPGQLTFGSAGLGTSHHVHMSFLAQQTGISMLHVPYKGGGPAMTDLLGGQIDFLMDPLTTTLPHVRTGRITPIAITSATRSALLPDVPTFVELGMSDFVVSSWFGLFAPAATPSEVVKRLSDALIQALQDSDVIHAMQSNGIDPMPKTSGEMADYLAQENMRWQRVMTQLKIGAE